MIYFIQAGEDGPVKIGFADDVRDRMACLQTGNHEVLRLIGVMPGLMTQEVRIHERFAEDHIRGEWFRPSDDLTRYVARHATGDLWTQALDRTRKAPRSPTEDFKAQEAEALAAIYAPPQPTVYKHRYGSRKRRSPRYSGDYRAP